jgi:hypothetical protein
MFENKKSPFSGFSAGIYFLTFHKEGVTVLTKKVVVYD